MKKFFKWLFNISDTDVEFGGSALPYGEGRTTVLNGDIFSPAANFPEFRPSSEFTPVTENVITVPAKAAKPKTKKASKKLGVKKSKTKATASARA